MAPYSAECAPPPVASILSASGNELFLPSAIESPRRRHQFGREATNKKLARKKRIQHFLGQIKLLVRQGWQRKGQQQRQLSTLDALDRALQMLRHSVATPLDNPGASISPSANSPSSSIPSPAQEESKYDPHPVTSPQSPPSTELHLKPCGCGSGDLQTPQGQPGMLGRRFLGSLLVSLPEGVVLECQDCPKNVDRPGELMLSGILRPGDSLLALLHGKGAQTMLLNAFCGHPRRRMYARMKWADDSTVRACELLCEFSIDPQSVSRRLANIQLFCVQSGALLSSPVDGNATIPQQAQLTFTTRHNSGCALIYLDSNSIPLLGHFPSEVTGKSLFTLVHPKDAPKIRDAHQQLHSSGGTQIVRTPGLRLLAYSGHSILVDSEWAAFVNPWTRHIEMVVGRHTFSANGQMAKDIFSVMVQERQHDQQASYVHALLAEPVPAVHSQSAASTNGPSPVLPTQPLVKEHQEQSEFPAQQTPLSYNQINCLENVHRLLKSQSQSRTENAEELVAIRKEEAGGQSSCIVEIGHPQSGSPSLTRELLQQHDQRWEEECRDHWRRRLSAGSGLKRSASGGQFDRMESPPPPKQFRRGSDGGAAIHNNQKKRDDQQPSPPLLFSITGQEQPSIGLGQFFQCLRSQHGHQPFGNALPYHHDHLPRQFTSPNTCGNVVQHPHLLDQLLQAANTARNTLALRLLQDQQPPAVHQQQHQEPQYS